MSPVELTNLVVPSVVENGTLPHIILDCQFHINRNEMDGMVLKWYLNSRTVPIYQWIPPAHPQVRKNII